MKTLILTAQRREEVAGMLRSEISGNDQTWHLSSARTKNGKAHQIPLTDAMLRVIGSIPKSESRDGFVFTTTGKTSISGFAKAKSRLDKLVLERARREAQDRGDDPEHVTIDLWRMHDLRRTAATGMARLGHPIHVVEAILNHRSGAISGVAAVYNRYSYADEKRKALEDWAEHVSRVAAS
jgi:integrase